MNNPNILLINPWIYDVAAYDLWLRPVGLLTIGAYLRVRGCGVRLVDCLDRFHPRMPRTKWARADDYGCGKFRKEEVEKPAPLKDTPRTYYRYGLPLDAFAEEVRAEKPDAVCVTSSMTYWYPGVAKAVDMVREAWPGVPVILGGTYATLMPAHARLSSGADRVLPGADLPSIASCIEEVTGMSLAPLEKNGAFLPDYGLASSAKSIALKTSRGCPFNCTYCASAILEPRVARVDQAEVASYLLEMGAGGTEDVAFYDDALLLDPEEHIVPLLERLVSEGSPLRLHAPNSLHARFLDAKLASLLKKAGFVTVRLSLETADARVREETGDKVSPEELESAFEALRGAGFDTEDIGVYIMLGLRGRSPEESFDDALYVSRLGAKPILASFSPIPGTGEWKRLLDEGVVSEATDPLWHNNTLFPLLQGLDLDDVSLLRHRISAL